MIVSYPTAFLFVIIFSVQPLSTKKKHYLDKHIDNRTIRPGGIDDVVVTKYEILNFKTFSKAIAR